jgi:hypothetical protein
MAAREKPTPSARSLCRSRTATAGTTATATRIALPEVEVLALTGGTMPLALGVGLLSLGVVLLIIGRRRPRSPRGRTGVDGMITR